MTKTHSIYSFVRSFIRWFVRTQKQTIHFIKRLQFTSFYERKTWERKTVCEQTGSNVKEIKTTNKQIIESKTYLYFPTESRYYFRWEHDWFQCYSHTHACGDRRIQCVFHFFYLLSFYKKTNIRITSYHIITSSDGDVLNVRIFSLSIARKTRCLAITSFAYVLSVYVLFISDQWKWPRTVALNRSISCCQLLLIFEIGKCSTVWKLVFYVFVCGKTCSVLMQFLWVCLLTSIRKLMANRVIKYSNILVVFSISQKVKIVKKQQQRLSTGIWMSVLDSVLRPWLGQFYQAALVHPN